MRTRASVWAALAGVVLAVAAGIWLAVDPSFYQGVSTTTSASGVVTTVSSGASLIAENGAWVIGVLCVPVALAAFGLYCAVARRRVLLWAAGLVLLGFVLLSGFTIGLFYVPAAVLVLIAAGLSPRPAPR
jgi:hypothetical protein